MDIFRDKIKAFIKDKLEIEADLSDAIERIYIPIARVIDDRQIEKSDMLVVGLSGGQGSGKTTWAAILRFLLTEIGLRAVSLSLDDLYLPLTDRERVRRENPGNPYYAAYRGNPGTHDVALGIKTVKSLASAGDHAVTSLPSFDKSLHSGMGDRVPIDQWQIFKGRPDVLILEGWFVGARPLYRDEYERLKSRHPEVVRFESENDPGGRFGLEINERLADYQPLFDMIDLLIYLRVPSISKVFEWRKLQERRLIERAGEGMSEAEVERFVRPYILLTAVHGLDVVGDPDRGIAELIVEIGEDQLPLGIIRCDAGRVRA